MRLLPAVQLLFKSKNSTVSPRWRLLKRGVPHRYQTLVPVKPMGTDCTDPTRCAERLRKLRS